MIEHAFERAERLNKKDFRRAHWKRSGKTPHFLLFKSKNEYAIARFGVVVSRKIKGAVKRNRVKRVLREFFRLNKHLFRGPANYSVRVMAMPRVLTLHTVSPELMGLLKVGPPGRPETGPGGASPSRVPAQ